MTLILKLDLDIVKTYHHTKIEVSMSTHSKVIAQTQTDRQTDTHTHTHRRDENITSAAYAGRNKHIAKCENFRIKNLLFCSGVLNYQLNVTYFFLSQ